MPGWQICAMLADSSARTRSFLENENMVDSAFVERHGEFCAVLKVLFNLSWDWCSGRMASASSLGCTSGRRATAASACHGRPRRCWRASTGSCRPRCAARTPAPSRSAPSRSRPLCKPRRSPSSNFIQPMPAITSEPMMLKGIGVGPDNQGQLGTHGAVLRHFRNALHTCAATSIMAFRVCTVLSLRWHMQAWSKTVSPLFRQRRNDTRSPPAAKHMGGFPDLYPIAAFCELYVDGVCSTWFYRLLV